MKHMNKWQPTTNPKELRRLGKLGEELGELQAVISRCIIQGIEEIDPSSGKQNRLRLQDELADCLTQLKLTAQHYNLDRDLMDIRVLEKTAQMEEWEHLCAETGETT